MDHRATLTEAKNLITMLVTKIEGILHTLDQSPNPDASERKLAAEMKNILKLHTQQQNAISNTPINENQ